MPQLRDHQADAFGMVGKPLTTSLAAGVDIKVISDILGHATSSFTADVYATVAESLAEAAASAIAAFVPRRAINVPSDGG